MKKQWILFGILLSALLGAGPASATPKAVILIRHAEKPKPEGRELSTRGWQRANALPRFFLQREEVTRFGQIAALYGMAPKDEYGSIRSIQTLIPLSQVLRLPIYKNFKRNHIERLVHEIRKTKAYDDKVVVICWQHETIRDIAKAFGYSEHLPDWPSATYDRAWLFTFHGKKAEGFFNIPQDLLQGDAIR